MSDTSEFLETYFKRLNWKTAGWRISLNIDGQTPWGKNNALEIIQNIHSTGYHLRYYNVKKRSSVHYDAISLVDACNWICSEDELIIEVLECNELDPNKHNDRIFNAAQDTVAKAKATREQNELNIVGDIWDFVTKETFEEVECIPVKESPDLLFPKIQYNLSSDKVSRLCTMFCKHNDIVPATKKSNEGFAIKLFHPALIRAIINYAIANQQ